jgi:hypothetical protein
MKRYLLICSLAILAACGSGKNYLERSDEDKALQDAVKRLEKDNTDSRALEAIPILYSNIKLAHQARIRSLENSKEITRWDNLVTEYESLQSAYRAILNSNAAYRLVSPVDYGTQLLETRQQASEAYYNLANEFAGKSERADQKKAYTYFKKADKFNPGFKDARSKADMAYENAIVDVVINPVQDNSFFFNSSWGNQGYNYSNEYFQQTLIRDLQSSSNSRYPARFYTDWQARRDNVQPDWVVDLRLRDMDIPYPTTYTYSRNASSRVQVGTDTAGKPQYQNVYATVYITRLNFNARANMEVNITDVDTRKNISYRNFHEEVRWQEERGNYSGDSRALSSRDWQIINNGNNYNDFRREDVLGELYRKIYPQVLNNIRYTVDW